MADIFIAGLGKIYPYPSSSGYTYRDAFESPRHDGVIYPLGPLNSFFFLLVKVLPSGRVVWVSETKNSRGNRCLVSPIPLAFPTPRKILPKRERIKDPYRQRIGVDTGFTDRCSSYQRNGDPPIFAWSPFFGFITVQSRSIYAGGSLFLYDGAFYEPLCSPYTLFPAPVPLDLVPAPLPQETEEL